MVPGSFVENSSSPAISRMNAALELTCKNCAARCVSALSVTDGASVVRRAPPEERPAASARKCEPAERGDEHVRRNHMRVGE